MITDVADYFTRGCGRCARFDTADCAARTWAQGLAELRALCRSAGLTETAKWGHPCYVHAGRNVAIIGALRGDFRLSFFHAALLADPAGVLERRGANTRHPDMIRFTHAAQVRPIAPVILRYLSEAMAHAAAGRVAPKSNDEIDLPDELLDALDADPELADAFHRLTPGRQKSYVIDLASAKTQATRLARIARYRGRILSGLGRLDR